MKLIGVLTFLFYLSKGVDYQDVMFSYAGEEGVNSFRIVDTDTFWELNEFNRSIVHLKNCQRLRHYGFLYSLLVIRENVLLM